MRVLNEDIKMEIVSKIMDIVDELPDDMKLTVASVIMANHVAENGGFTIHAVGRKDGQPIMAKIDVDVTERGKE